MDLLGSMAHEFTYSYMLLPFFCSGQKATKRTGARMGGDKPRQSHFKAKFLIRILYRLIGLIGLMACHPFDWRQFTVDRFFHTQDVRTVSGVRVYRCALQFGHFSCQMLVRNISIV